MEAQEGRKSGPRKSKFTMDTPSERPKKKARRRLEAEKHRESSDVYVEESQRAKKMDFQKITGIQRIYGDVEYKNGSENAEVDAAIAKIKEIYVPIRQEFNKMVEEDRKEKLRPWQAKADEAYDPRLRNLGIRMRNLQVAEWEETPDGWIPGFGETIVRDFVGGAKPYSSSSDDRDNRPNVKRTVNVLKLPTGDIYPPMVHWIPIETSIPMADQLRLTHMPYFPNASDDNDMYEKLIDHFPDGISGFAFASGPVRAGGGPADKLSLKRGIQTVLAPNDRSRQGSSRLYHSSRIPVRKMCLNDKKSAFCQIGRKLSFNPRLRHVIRPESDSNGIGWALSRCIICQLVVYQQLFGIQSDAKSSRIIHWTTGYPLLCTLKIWPNKFSQREFSTVFPKLCELFSENESDWEALEPWKSDEFMNGIADNLDNLQCYSCLTFACGNHGFRCQLPPEHPNGDVSLVHLPLPTDQAPPGEKCSDKCWRTLKKEKIHKILTPSAEEISEGQAKIWLCKESIGKMSIENGAMIAAMFLLDQSDTFCDFVKSYVREGSEPRFKTCRDIYELIASLAENFSDRQILIGQAPKMLPHQARDNAFRRLFANKEKKLSESETQSNQDSASINGTDSESTNGMEDRKPTRPMKTGKKSLFDTTLPFKGCRHNGPCGPDVLECSCRENMTCSAHCHCDKNCKQRFPGCACRPGQCNQNKCQCFLAGWECDPLTCFNCKCDDITNPKSCKNIPMTKMLQKRMMCCPSGIAGNGLFLLESVEKDEFITEYVGERISDAEAERRGAIYDKIQCSYIFSEFLDKNFYLSSGGAIDSNKLGNLSRFANCASEKDATLYARTKVIGGEHRIGFYAKHAMEPNTELTFDYGYSFDNKEKMRRERRVSPVELPNEPSSDDVASTSTSSPMELSEPLKPITSKFGHYDPDNDNHLYF
ncbi:Protein CBR-MES-2 [Caenorhabditis briggsae]|uniref:[histone H3]-lysine(27) N-trimethyltransferase n=1 Tax=Caenorhabditis briggsae TaxID=6238 RepID=A8XCE5_CAEBR|nr:Protein CBR-MES-2 [Caenorhabditis briggsae]CAP30312.2 Protein CBR-MES-2 [Caenorhabditis briggsae]